RKAGRRPRPSAATTRPPPAGPRGTLVGHAPEGQRGASAVAPAKCRGVAEPRPVRASDNGSGPARAARRDGRPVPRTSARNAVAPPRAGPPGRERRPTPVGRRTTAPIPQPFRSRAGRRGRVPAGRRGPGPPTRGRASATPPGGAAAAPTGG